MKEGLLLAAALVVVGCNHDAWNTTYDKTASIVSESEKTFMNSVMESKSIDAKQTWNTAVPTEISLTVAKAGTLKVYAQDPVGNNPAPFYTATVEKGDTKTFNMARPQYATTLYAVVYDSENYVIDNLAFDASESKVEAAFYTADAAAARKMAPRRAIQPIFNFPQDADASKFLSSVPAGVQKLTQNAAMVNNYIDGSWTGELNIWGGWDGSKNSGGTLYITGTHYFLDRKFYVAPNTDIYLLEGAVLVLGDYEKNASNLQAGCNIYLAPGAKIATPYGVELVLNNGLHLYNHGTIDVEKLSVNNTSVLYNSSEVQVRGELSVENQNSVIVNDGVMTATRLHTAGSGHVQNNSTMTINGNTDIDSNDNTWVNNGQYTTNYFYYTAGSCDVINNCKLTVKELFKINLGDTDKNGFRMDSNSGVVTKNFEAAGPSYIFMGANSVFQVEETATMNITKDFYGIYGPATGDAAVFTAKEIANGAANKNQGFVANYFQQLVVATDKHFAQGYSDKSAEQQANGEIGVQPYYRIGDGARLVEKDYTGISIDATACNPGFNGGGKKKDEEPQQWVYYAFEDLGVTADYDFNDVVLRVGVPNENRKAEVQLCAIGGNPEKVLSTVFCDDTQIGEEVHNYGEFGDNTKKMVGVPIVKLGEVDVPEGKTVAELNMNIHVYVKSDGREVTVTAPKAGEVPFRVVVTGDEQGKWFWPRERIAISDAYTLFGQWGANMESNPDWFKSYIKSGVIRW